MAEIKITKIKLRRGTNNERKTVILDQGEVVYTTDTKRLFVGNGVLSGGDNVSSRVHPILNNYLSLSSLNAERNDIVQASNIWYQLTGTDSTTLSSWANISQKIGTTLQYEADGTLSVKLSSLSASHFNPVTVNSGLKVESGNIQVNYDTKSLNVSSDKLTVRQGGIDEWEINTSTFTNGITGGSSNKVGLRVNPVQFYFSSGILNLSSIPSGSLTFSSIDPSWIGDGLIHDGINQKLKSVITDVDNVTTTKDLSGIISVMPGYVPQTITGVLTGNSTSNASNSLSAIFNGTPAHTINGGIPGLTVTTFETISSNGVTTAVVSLTSAGFIAYQGNITLSDGQVLGRYAIPVFAF